MTRTAQPALAETRSARDHRLVRLITRRLAWVAALFVLLQVALVVVLYMRDEQTLIEDLVAVETERVRAILRPIGGRWQLGAIARTDGAWGAAVFDADGQRVHVHNPGGLPLPDRIPGPQLTAETTREQRGEVFLIRGTRRVQVEGQSCWIAVTIAGAGFAPLLPALGFELLQHVALPLLPLSVLLLVFNVAVVRRMLVPLDTAVAEVNALDPGQIGNRVQVPDSPLEVRTLLGAINRALERMALAIRQLRQFTADAAHELRTPLAVMTLGIGQLPPSPEREKLKDDAACMTRLVNQLLDLARVDALEIDPQIHAPLDDVAGAVVRRMLLLAVHQGCSIAYTLHGNPVVVGPPELLERVVANIVQNALSHTPTGSTVDVSVGPGAQLTVRDHGPGIPSLDRTEVFRRFWRKEGTRGQGAGLGLAIALGIMQAVGGRIDIEDAPGGGALLRLGFVAV